MAIVSLALRRISAKKLLVLLLLLPLVAAAFSAFAQDGAPAATQTSVQQGVTVKVTPRVVGAGNARWQFAIVLDTHSSDLNDDLVNTVTLVTADGREVRSLAWTGAAPGGHHREGVLEFTMAAPWPTAIELKLARQGEAAPRIFRWQF
ncbi:MAG: hypothetical protein Q8R06_12085 [Polaromonas sp.]|nr:hypothetical protein [Polaromonas sp.]